MVSDPPVLLLRPPLSDSEPSRFIPSRPEQECIKFIKPDKSTISYAMLILKVIQKNCKRYLVIERRGRG